MLKKIFILLLPLTVVLAASNFAFAASLSIDISNLQLDENPLSANHAKTFNLKLTPAPSSEVTTNFSTNGECLLGHNNKAFTTGGSVYTKSPSLYFGIRTLDDAKYEGVHICEISFTSVSTSDPNYTTSVTKKYNFTVTDNDTNNPAGFNVVSVNNARMQEGASAVETYEVQILKAAKDDIAIVAIAGDQCDLLVGSGANQARVRTTQAIIRGGTQAAARFTIIPREDTEFEGIHQCTIQHATATDDPEFSGVSAPAYITSIADNDVNPDIPDEREYEGGLIYFKDANYDGIDDSEQPQVVSFINPMHGNRQAFMINDVDGHLSESCRFGEGPTAARFDSETQSSQIVSSQGEITLDIACDQDEDYQLIWLLDKYYEEAKDWTIYQEDSEGNLVKLAPAHIVYNLGDDFTSALVIDTEDNNPVVLLQDDVSSDALTRVDEEDTGLAASIRASNSNIVLYAVFGLAGMILVFAVYWRFFRQFDSHKTIAPDIDRF